MEISLALFCTLVAAFVGWLYVAKPWKNSSKSCDERLARTSKTKVEKEIAHQGVNTKCSNESIRMASQKIKEGRSTENVNNGSLEKDSTDAKSKNSCNIDDSKNDSDNIDISDLIINPDEVEMIKGSDRVVDENTDSKNVREYVKNLRENKLEEMTDEEKEEEQRIQRQQLAEIFKLMQTSQDTFGIDSMEQMEEQMKLYTG